MAIPSYGDESMRREVPRASRKLALAAPESPRACTHVRGQKIPHNILEFRILRGDETVLIQQVHAGELRYVITPFQHQAVRINRYIATKTDYMLHLRVHSWRDVAVPSIPSFPLGLPQSHRLNTANTAPPLCTHSSPSIYLAPRQFLLR